METPMETETPMEIEIQSHLEKLPSDLLQMICKDMCPKEILDLEKAVPEISGRIPLSLTLSSSATIMIYGQTEGSTEPFTSFRVSYDIEKYSIFTKSSEETFESFFMRIALSNAVRPVLLRNLEWVSLQKCIVEPLLEPLFKGLKGVKISILELNLSSTLPFCEIFDMCDLVDLRPATINLYVNTHKALFFARLLRQETRLIPVSVLFGSERIRRECVEIFEGQLIE